PEIQVSGSGGDFAAGADQLGSTGGTMERPMSIVVADETTPATHNARYHWAAPAETMEGESHQPLNADAESPSADHPMRLPSFDEVCPHVRDHIIPMNGGHFNVDHYLRVLRAKAETDVSVAMALTALGQEKTAARA